MMSMTIVPNVSQKETLQETTQEAISEVAKNLMQLADFIILRQQQKQALNVSQKNSLSNLNNQSEKKSPKEIIQMLGEQLNEGHTIYHVSDNEQKHNLSTMFQEWQQQSWLTILPPSLEQQDNIKNSSNLTAAIINTPIVMKPIAVNCIAGQGESNPNSSTDFIFWLQRQWYAEHQLAKQLLTIAHRPTSQLAIANERSGNNDCVSEASLASVNEQQQKAIEQASRFSLSIITGGPGTGKTFTVAKLVTRLQQAHEAKQQQDPTLPPLSIVLTAPTGKAAQRMQESLVKNLGEQAIGFDKAKTLHRLLGIGVDGTPRYHGKNPLPDDLIIVDEASMLGLELASMLVDAIKPTGRLILLGDANQLAAVDAGSVLADLCQIPALQPYRTELVESKRFDDASKIGQLAQAIQQSPNQPQKLKKIYSLLDTKPISAIIYPQHEDVARQSQSESLIPFYEITDKTPYQRIYELLAQPYQRFFELISEWYKRPADIHQPEIRQKLFNTFDNYRILTAGHQGQLGSIVVNKKMAIAFYKATQLIRTPGFFYHGMPIMIMNNDYQLGLFNGDIGICLLANGQLWACFPEKVIATSRLSIDSCEPAYAMTIHKSQGSEFDNVAICLDKVHSRLLSQELIYTAVTRSKQGLSVFSQASILQRAITQKANRQTGLQLQFE